MKDPYYDLDLLSNSRLGIVKSIINGTPIFKVKKETLDFGSQLHEAVFEPEKYAINLVSNPSYRVNKFKILEMTKAALKNDLLKMLLNNPESKKEFQHLFCEDKYGIECKIKIDVAAPKTIGDLKSTSCKTYAEFLKSIEDYDYDRQGAFYLDGYGAEEFVLFGISKTFPHPTFTVPLRLDHPLIIQGRKKYEDLLDNYLELKQKGEIDFQKLMNAA